MALVVDSNSRVHLIGILSRTSFRERLLQMTELLPPEEILHGYGQGKQRNEVLCSRVVHDRRRQGLRGDSYVDFDVSGSLQKKLSAESHLTPSP
jgi:hypothetical protein